MIESAIVPYQPSESVQKPRFLDAQPTERPNEQLADIVIEGVKTVRSFLPLVIELKKRFDTGERDSNNRLKEPIKDCYTWIEFCNNRLDRTPQAIGQLLIEAKGIVSVCPL